MCIDASNPEEGVNPTRPSLLPVWPATIYSQSRPSTPVPTLPENETRAQFMIESAHLGPATQSNDPVAQKY